MRNAELPALAAWLLKRLGPRRWSESLTRELLEKYAQGRSPAWVWKQVGVAITSQVWQDIRNNKLVAVRGVITGWVSLACFAVLVGGMLGAFGGPSVHAVRWQWPQYVLLFVIGFAYTAVSGWVVGRVHRTHRPAAVFSYLGSVLIVSVCAFPLYYWLVPSLFVSTIVPHLAFFLTMVVGAPVSIMVGGFWGATECMQANGAAGL